jgi:hypothetical protein
MGMINDVLEIEIVSSAVNTPLQLDSTARALLDEVLGLPGAKAELAIDPVLPSGAKSIAANLPSVIIALGTTGALLPAIVTAIRDWLVRQPPATTIKIKDGDFELEWCGTTPPVLLEKGAAELLARRTT